MTIENRHASRAYVYCVVLCVAFLVVASGWMWCHAMGLRSTKVVLTIEKKTLPDRYTIPAWKEEYVAIWDMWPIYDTRWHDAKVVQYESWVVTSFDGFVLEFEKVDPMKPPKIDNGDRYTGWWK